MPFISDFSLPAGKISLTTTATTTADGFELPQVAEFEATTTKRRTAERSAVRELN